MGGLTLWSADDSPGILVSSLCSQSSSQKQAIKVGKDGSHPFLSASRSPKSGAVSVILNEPPIVGSIRSCPRAADTGSGRGRRSPWGDAQSPEHTPASPRHGRQTLPPASLA